MSLPRKSTVSERQLEKEGPVQFLDFLFFRQSFERRWLKLTSTALSLSVANDSPPLLVLQYEDIVHVDSPVVVNGGLANPSTGQLETFAFKRLFSSEPLNNEDFVVWTSRRSQFRGKQLVLRAPSSELRDDWVTVISTLKARCPKTSEGERKFENLRMLQSRARSIYLSDDVQTFIAVFVRLPSFFVLD